MTAWSKPVWSSRTGSPTSGSQVQSVDYGDAVAVRGALHERLALARAKLDRYARLRERLLGDRDEDTYLAEADRIGPFLTLRRGIAFEEENVRFCRMAIKVIDRRFAGQ